MTVQRSSDRAASESGHATAPWWVVEPGPRRLYPLFSISLFGLPNRRLDAVLTLALVLLIGASRIAAFPASIWEQDEAYLAAGVVRFDPTDNQPHPPWFPLWIALGKAAGPLAEKPATALQMLSSVFSVWSLFPIVALFGLWLRREVAVAAALLYLFTPASWLLAGRAFTETPATMLLVVTAAYWMRPEPSRRVSAKGSVAAATCLLVRPQFALAVIGMGLVRWWRNRELGAIPYLAGPVGAGVLVGGSAVAVAAGGPAPMWRALATHARYHVDGLQDVSWSFASSGLARALIQPWVAAGWVALGLVGLIVWHRHRRRAGGPWPLVFGGIAPMAATVYLLSNPSHARYAVPLLALSCGPVAVALASMHRWTARLVVGLAVVGSCAAGWPQLATYRTTPSPPVRAVRAALDDASGRGAVIVVDRTLLSFVGLERLTSGGRISVFNDFQLETGTVVPRPEDRIVAVFDRGRGGFVVSHGGETTYSCDLEWPRRMGQDRFLDVTVAVGVEVAAAPTAW
jgi:uncharacterized membrane protein HdeD (DUF308 family)